MESLPRLLKDVSRRECFIHSSSLSQPLNSAAPQRAQLGTAFASRSCSPEAEWHDTRGPRAGRHPKSHQGSQRAVFRFSRLSPTRFSFYFEQSLQSAGKPSEPARPVPPPTDTSQGMAATSSSTPRRIMNIKRKHEDKAAGLPPRPQTSPLVMNGVSSPSGPISRTSQQRASTSQTRPLGISIAGAATRNGQPATAQEDELRVAKRPKKGGGSDEPPSLLSRLAAQPAGSNGRSSGNPTGEVKRRVDSTSSAQPPRQRQQVIDKDPVVGFSIKGAAKASGPTNGHSSPTQRTSLLARLQGDEQATGGQRRRRKARVS